jgi:hypothetical protein
MHSCVHTSLADEEGQDCSIDQGEVCPQEEWPLCISEPFKPAHFCLQRLRALLLPIFVLQSSVEEAHRQTGMVGRLHDMENCLFLAAHQNYHTLPIAACWKTFYNDWQSSRNSLQMLQQQRASWSFPCAHFHWWQCKCEFFYAFPFYRKMNLF